MNCKKIFSIGKIQNKNGKTCISLDPKFKKGIIGLEGFGHIQVLWWAGDCDTADCRSKLVESQPYISGPESMGVFATRSPQRPNPIAITTVGIANIDYEAGIIWLYYIDAFDGTDVIDIKPYTPSFDRINNPKTPKWCSHWPKSYEESADFDWGKEFNF